ncbi:hypothetical protein EMGBS15_05190 [Filimonas sp.]|nr:hypothetical protein EMGBS15_05190 [Filimonas sp.]
MAQLLSAQETNSTLLTLSAYTGSIQWQSSVDNVTFNDMISETSAAYTATNLTATTYYRAVVTSGVCPADTSSSVAITVSPISVAGSVSGATTVMYRHQQFALRLNRQYRKHPMAIIC